MSTIADTSRGVVRYIKESTAGVTPAAALTEIRMIGESLNQTKTTETSNEIRPDRQITDIIPTDSEPSGDISFELSYDNLDDFIPAALLSAGWSTVVAVSETDISAAAADNSYNTVAGDFTGENISVGQWIKVSGFTTNAVNNGYCRVVSIAVGKLVVSGITLVNETAGDTIVMEGSMARNGVTSQSFSIEKGFIDIGQFVSYLGMEASTFSLDISTNAIVKGAIGFMGRTASVAQTSIGTGAAIAAPTNDVFNATSNVANVRENGIALSAATFCAQSISISLDNGLRGQKCIGLDGNRGIGKGRCNVTGSLGAYFVDEVLLEKFLNGTATSIDFRISDAAGNAYIVTMPKVKYTSGNPELTGVDADVLIPLDYRALRDPTTDCTIQIDKFDA